MTTPAPIEIFDSLHDFVHVFRARASQRLEAVQPDLTFSEVRILLRAGHTPGLTQKELIEITHVDKAQITRMLDRLETQGWVTRVPDEQDKRVRRLQLTPQGGALFARLRDAQHQVADELFRDFPVALREQMYSMFRQVCRDAADKA